MIAKVKNLGFDPLHPNFGAEVTGVDWSKPIPANIIDEIREGADKYGVLVFRKTSLDNSQHVAFTSQFGELFDVRSSVKSGRSLRFPNQPEIFDVSNLDENGNVITDADPARKRLMAGNALWHSDMAFFPQRASYSLLRAAQLPPKGTGGETEYLDSRTAYEDLPESMKERLRGLICNNSLMHNRKLGAPEIFEHIEPLDMPMARHRAVVPHEGSKRENLYVTTYCHHFDGETMEESKPLIEEVLKHVSQEKYKLLIPWIDDGDMVLWDNRAVLHRATAGGSCDGRHVRDMRRTTVKDGGAYAWGENTSVGSWETGLSSKPS